MILRLLATIGVLFLMNCAAAHDGHDHSHTSKPTVTGNGTDRAWTDTRTGAQHVGSILLSRDGQVTIETQAGHTVELPLNSLSEADRSLVAEQQSRIERLNTRFAQVLVAQRDTAATRERTPDIARDFAPFVDKGRVRLDWDDKYLIVESDGLPDHPMMVGITAWNRQVPIPHSYSGNNAFRIPLSPTFAAKTTPAPYLNAIAVAVNGVPIFHPIKQDGRTDTVTAGELDQYGGHAGRADDYHYHIAPTHLAKIVGNGNPVAYALDGFPIIPAPEKDGKPTIKLDELNGAKDAEGKYAYYATLKPPYIMPGFRGTVDWSLQPRARGVRPYTQPLRGATITGFEHPKADQYKLIYEHQGGKHTIAYQTQDNGSVEYTFIQPSGESRTETYQRRQQEQGRRKGQGGQRRGSERDRPTTDDRATGGIRKPTMSDTIKANVYADNTFTMYINGELVAVDSIRFIPHNVISVDYLPTYPMTIAVMAHDNADPNTGMEYANTNIGDGGFILKFSDGTVTNGQWRAKRFSWGPIGGDTDNPRVESAPVPKDWYAVDFDDSDWKHAKEFTEEQVDPKGPFYDHDFSGAKFIWSDDLALDNTVIFRHRVQSPPDGIQRPDFSNLTNQVPTSGRGKENTEQRRRNDDEELFQLIDEFMREGERRGGPQSDSPRQPWIVVHAKELDTDSNGVVTRQEMTDEAIQAFTGYDADSDGRLTQAEYERRSNVKSAMGGFIRGHAKELDRNNDGSISREEVLANATQMYDRVDRDSDGKLTAEELKFATRTSGGGQERRQRDGQKPVNDTSSLPTLPSKLSAASQSDHPNIVLVLIDDMGWKDMGFAGNTFVETPTADRLAREGVIFTQAYASAPNCAPTRACLMSGQYTPRHGVFTVIDERHTPGQPHHRILASASNEAMSGDVVTIPEALKTAGYATGCFGMWNLGRGRTGPSTATGQGFDVYKKPQDMGFDRSRYFDDDNRYLTDVVFDEGIRFIEDNADKPFFLYLPTHAIHAPFEPKPELLAKYQRKAVHSDNRNSDPVYAAMIEAVDQNIDKLIRSLERLSLADNTMIVFTSDNGGTPEYVAPLNGSKGALYEGGIRVPAFIWWSGIKQPGRTSPEPISSIDFYPTILAAAGVNAPTEHPLDGQSLLPILSASGRLERDALFWHFPCYIGKSSPCSAIRMGEYKLIEFFEDSRVELYNLREDVSESHDIAKQMPSKAGELQSMLTRWRGALDAPIPNQPNPAFDITSLKKQRGNKGAGRGRQRQTAR